MSPGESVAEIYPAHAKAEMGAPVCGIAGWLGHCADAEVVSVRLVRALHHRGPDSHGVRFWSEAALIHTRLSIIDLSPAGAQPMANEDGTIWVVLNGEIYNHIELRRELESRGHRFRGRSDTEVLPHLYEDEGPAFVRKLRGMFGLAIYDSTKQILILARDRFGIKPVFYAAQGDRLAFASEINALLAVPEIDTRPDKQAVSDLAALFYIPAPETFYRGIRALEPGQMLTAEIRQGQLHCRLESYHSWSVAPDCRLSLCEAADRTEELVRAAVRRQLESDVPLGALLSGGIDSSLVSCSAQEALETPIRTFNVRFPDETYDETWAALSVAAHIGSRHETLPLQAGEGCWEDVAILLRHCGQPYADTSLFAANAVCRLIRQHVTVALSGDGGDEGFGGYSHYWELARIAQLQRFPQLLWTLAAGVLQPLARRGIVPRHVPAQLQEFAAADDVDILESLFSYVGRQEHAALCADIGALPVRRLFEPQWQNRLPRGAARLERLSAHATEVNVRLPLANDFLFKVDTASMRESLEVRVPLLDEELFEFALSLPHALKVKARTGKRVLRELAQRKLPGPVARKEKMGFAIPVDTWLDQDFRVRLRETLLGPSCRLGEFFRPEAYQPLVEGFCDGQPHRHLSRREVYGRIVMLLSVQLALADPS